MRPVLRHNVIRDHVGILNMEILFYLFTYLYSALFLYAVLCLPLRLILLCTRIRLDRGPMYLVIKIRWSLLILFCMFLLAPAVASYWGRFIDPTPEPPQQSDIVGLWKKGHVQITVNQDSTASYGGTLRRNNTVYDDDDSFNWFLDKTAFYLQPSESGQTFRWEIITFCGQYRMVYDNQDSNLHLPDLGFVRVRSEH